MLSSTMIALLIFFLEMTAGNDCTTYCSEERYQHGRWVPGASNCGLKAIYNHSLADPACSPTNKSLPLPYSFADWCWKPTGCISKAFSVEGFCKKLKRRRILMIGDSIQFQFFQALFMQLETPGQPIDQWEAISQFNHPEMSGICLNKGGGHLVYLRNDQISVTTKTPWNASGHHHVVHDRDFTAIADQFDIFVLNKGAHHVNIEEFQEELLLTADWLKTYIEDQSRNISLFFRTTSQGHPNASSEIEPITEVLTKEPNWVKVTSYNWESFPMYDRLAMHILNEALGSKITFLKVSYMTQLRPDGHRCQRYMEPCDQLHYFLPSVIDSWVQVFYNLLT
jgi:hypothetical protein